MTLPEDSRSRQPVRPADGEAGASPTESVAGVVEDLSPTAVELRQKVEQLNTLFQLSTLLAAQHDTQRLLDTAARRAAEVMQVKSASIRLLSEDGTELLTEAVYNLSEQYLNKGPILVERSVLYSRTLDGQVIYVRDMATDPRVLYPQDAQREGLVSILSAPMIFQSCSVGVIRLYTGQERHFSESEVDLLTAIAQLMATAIANARLSAEQIEHQQTLRQLKMAAAVQRRMLPASMPKMPPFDIFARFDPSYELSGDFYDFIHLKGHLGIAVGDVVGKGIAASLLMASVRSALRAYAQDLYDLDEVISRVNVAMTRETLDNEFVTLFYGVVDPATLRMTYCNAGHEPPLLLRREKIIRLEEGGMIVGVDESQAYEKGVIDLEPADKLLIYTDGLTEARHFGGEFFGRQRIDAALRDSVGKSASDTVSHVFWEMRRFIGLNRNLDDTTIVALNVDPAATMPSGQGETAT